MKLINSFKAVVGNWIMSKYMSGDIIYIDFKGITDSKEQNNLLILKEISKNSDLSMSQLKRLEKEGGIKIAINSEDIWVKIGKTIFVLSPDLNNSMLANGAQIWWEYHHELMPKKLKWSKYTLGWENQWT